MSRQDSSEDNDRRSVLDIVYGGHVPHVLEGQLLRTSDVARLFEVSERTVSEWAKRGQIPSVRTPGGHRRYPAEGVRAVLESAEEATTAAGPAAPRRP